MEFDKFKRIIEYNHNNQEEVGRKVRGFYSRIGMDYESDVLNILQVVRPLLQKEKYIVVEIPFKDTEIGAICYKGDSYGYTFLNSALPKVNINFALCHEIFHIFYQEKPFNHKVELYMNKHYFEHEDEMSANLFAGLVLMPEQSFIRMFNKFQMEADNLDTELSLIVKLMNYFEVPFMASVIRCYELKLLDDGGQLEKLLSVHGKQVEEEFLRLWLNDEILRPTNKDDYQKLKLLVQTVGTKYKEEGILNERAVKKVLENMQSIYEKIRG